MITTNSSGAPLSADYQKAVQSDSRNFLARFSVDGTELDCDIARFTAEKGSCASADAFTVGDVISNKLDATLKNVTSLVKGQEITVEVGLLVNEDYDWVEIGTFVATNVKKTYYVTTVTGYGFATAKTGVAFVEPEVKTIANICAAVQTATGVEVVVDDSIDASTVVEASLAGYTCYGVLKEIASLVGGYVTDTHDGKIAVKHYSNVKTIDVNTGMMIKLPDVEEEDYVVTGVQYVVQEAGETGLGTIVPEVAYSEGEPINLVVSQPMMTKGLFENCKYLAGYWYRAGLVELSLGDPRLEGDDVLCINGVVFSADGQYILRSTQGVLKSTQGILRIRMNNYIVPCHKIIHTYDGGFFSQIQAVTNVDLGTQTELMTRLETVEQSEEQNEMDIKDVSEQATETSNYFWYQDGTGAESGAHVTEIPREQFAENPTGGNLLMQSDGVKARHGQDVVGEFGDIGTQFFNDDGESVALIARSAEVHSKHYTENPYISISKGTSSAIDNQTFTSEKFTLPELDDGTTVYVPVSCYMSGGVGFLKFDAIITYGTASSESFGEISDSDGNKMEVTLYNSAANEVYFTLTITHKAIYRIMEAKIYSNTIYYYTLESSSFYRFGTKDESLSETAGYGLEHGSDNEVTGDYGIATGIENQSDGLASFTSGLRNKAYLAGSAAFGVDSVAGRLDVDHKQFDMELPLFAFGLGVENTSSDKSSMVVGQYNEIESNNELFVVGNGTDDDDRSNAFVVKDNGDATVAGAINGIKIERFTIPKNSHVTLTADSISAYLIFTNTGLGEAFMSATYAVIGSSSQTPQFKPMVTSGSRMSISASSGLRISNSSTDYAVTAIAIRISGTGALTVS